MAKTLEAPDAKTTRELEKARAVIMALRASLLNPALQFRVTAALSDYDNFQHEERNNPHE